MIKGLAHIGVFVKDLEVSKKFYRDVLGFDLPCSMKNDLDGAKVCFARRGDIHIELVEFPEYTEKKDGFIDHIAMEVDDIDAAKKELEAKGIVFEMDEPVYLADVYDGCKYLLFRGPDGEHLEIDQMM